MTPIALERELLALYELTLPLDVESVLISEPALLDRWLPAAARRPREQLLVGGGGNGEAAIALYLDEGVLAHVAADDPRAALHEGNLQAFLHVLEGVSHFVCVAWNAQFDREVSAFELELQAEVDKFLVCHGLLERQGAPDANALLVRLFDAIRYDEALEPSERWRYETSSAYARRYCAQLAPRLALLAERPRVTRELRRFYRLSAAAKLAHIGRD